MKDYVYCGGTPLDEYPAKDLETQKLQAQAFIHELHDRFGSPPANSYFEVKFFEHDLGGYYEVLGHYDDDYLPAVEYMEHVEVYLPTRWSKVGLDVINGVTKPNEFNHTPNIEELIDMIESSDLDPVELIDMYF